MYKIREAFLQEKDVSGDKDQKTGRAKAVRVNRVIVVRLNAKRIVML